MKKVLVIGAGFLQDFVIRKAKSMGYETLAVDGNPNAVGFQHADKYKTINIVDEEACLEYAKSENVNGVLTAATDYGVLTAAYIAQELHLPGLRYDIAQLVKNKYRVRKCLYENRVDDTEQAYEVDENTDLDLLCESIVFPVMVKPCDGSGSRGASRVDNPECFATACEFAMNASITHRAVVETFVVGKEYGAECFVVNGQIYVLSIMRKWMTEPPYYAELGHTIPTDLAPEVEMRAKECARNAIKALGINFGSVNMDMLITTDGKVHIIDIGARMGGNMIGPCVIPYGTGIDYVANMIRGAVGDEINMHANSNCAVATRLLAFSKGVVKQLPDFSALEKEYGVEIYHHMEAGQQVNEYHTNLDGCGYIVAKSDTPENAENAAKTVLEIIRRTTF